MYNLLLISTFFSNIPSELLWGAGVLIIIYLVIKLMVKLVMKIITIAAITFLTYFIKTGILTSFFQ